MQENKLATKKFDTRYTVGNLHGWKTQPPKASITMYYSTKIPLHYNHGSLQCHSHNHEIHVKMLEDPHIPCHASNVHKYSLG